MECTQNGALGNSLCNGCGVFNNVLFGNFAQNLFAEKGGNLLHFLSHRGVFIGKVAVAASGVNNAERMIGFFKIKRNLFNQRL